MVSSDSNIVWHSYWRMAAEGGYVGARRRLVAAQARLLDPEWTQRMRPAEQQELAKLYGEIAAWLDATEHQGAMARALNARLACLER
jgi:hypothetical protein